MGRQALRITILLGILITLIGGTGIFAVFTDRATGGQDSVTSAGLASAADIKIDWATVSATDPSVNCDADGDSIIGNHDDITTPQFSVANVVAGANLGTAYVCIDNAGSAPVSLVVSQIELTDIDTACTGDEAAAGDADCGGNQAGELSPLLFADTDRVDCLDAGVTLVGNAPMSLTSYQQTVASASEAMQPNTTACFAIHMSYPDPGQASLVQMAQSDQATWRFAFDATAQ